MKKVKLGLIGCGGIAQAHCRAMSEVEGAEIVAGCDIIPGEGRSHCSTVEYPQDFHRL